MNPHHKSQFRTFRRPRHITKRPKSEVKMTNNQRLLAYREQRKSDLENIRATIADRVIIRARKLSEQLTGQVRSMRYTTQAMVKMIEVYKTKVAMREADKKERKHANRKPIPLQA
jgi:hypothetical protein